MLRRRQYPSKQRHTLFSCDLQNSLSPNIARGSATPTYTRATTASVPDFEGIIHTALAGEARFKGSRRVHNLLTASEDMENAAYLFGDNAVASSPATITYDGTANGRVSQEKTIIDDGGGAGSRTFTYSVNVRLVSGTISSDSALVIRLTGSAIGSDVDVSIGAQVSGTNQRYTVSSPIDAAGTGVACQVAWGDAGVLEITEWQLEETTGQANQNPSEYVSSGVGTGVELFVDSFDSVGTGWVDNGDGTATHTGAPTGNLDSDVGMVSGLSYAVTYTISGTVGSMFVYCDSGDESNQVHTASTAGTYSFPVATTGDTITFRTNGAALELSGISIKEASHGANVDAVAYPGTGGLGMGAPCLNGNTVSSNVVTEATGIPITDVGVELVTNGDFSDGLTGWTNDPTIPYDTFEVSGGALHLVNTAGTTESAYSGDTIALVAGKSYIFAADLVKNSGTDDWEIRLRSDPSGTERHTITTTATTEALSVAFTAAVTEDVVIQFIARSAFDGTIDNASVKPVHYYADAKGSYGYMSEAAATNICLQSGDITTTWTTGSATPVSNYAVGVFGTSTADRLIDNSAGGTGPVSIIEAITVTSGTNTVFVYAKLDQINFLAIRTFNYDAGGSGTSWFNLSTGAVGTKDANHSTSNIEALPNGWYRCDITFSTTTDLTGEVRLYAADADNDFITDLDGTSSILIDGVQVEAGSFGTSYNATTTTAVTRNAEIDSQLSAGNIATNNGTIVVEWTPQALAMGTVFIWGTYVDASNYTAILHNGTNIIFRKRIGGVNNDATKALTYAADTTYTLVATYSDTLDSEIYVDGVQGTGVAHTVDAQIGTTYEIGSDGNGAQQSYGSQRFVKHYMVAKSAAEAATL